jgi:serine/threonine protein kinase
MSSRESEAARIFLEAVEHHEGGQRAAFIREAAAGDSLVLQRVDALLKAHGEANPLLDGNRLMPTEDFLQPSERPGAVIGPYKLLEQIGEGGMGLVFMAEQTQPVRRKVALKVLKPGMDTRQVVARFEAERQALALMDHPHIAKIHDAGTTATGRPYFVMELVRGVPITEFCDQRRLTTRQRLELFATVCQAVQHAHHKGIIHRDLKPSNVLVTLHDTVAVPKVIDFGIAKATCQPLTERTLFTHFAQLVGTPLYMSPEQAEMNCLDVDTRSDVYSLGVLLYELLTGTTPFESETLKKASLDEMRRMIREEEPPAPSQRLHTLEAQACSTVSERRGVDGRRLRQLLRGELDWIVMKALEKDRDRRYESASAFAQDVQRYLSDEAVAACPPTTGYRLRKYVRRNRGALATVGVIAAVLFVATAVSTWQAARAREAQHQAEANARAARRAVDKMYLQVAEKWLGQQPLMQEVQKEFVGEVLRFYQEFSLQEMQDRVSRFETAMANQRAGIILNYSFSEKTQAREVLLRARSILQRLLEEDSCDPQYLFELAHTCAVLAHTVVANNDLEEEELRQSVRLLEQLITRFPTEPKYRAALGAALANLCNPMIRGGRWLEVRETSQHALALLEPLIRESPKPEYCRSMAGAYRHLAEALPQGGGTVADAIDNLRNAIASLERLARDASADPEYQHGLTPFDWHLVAFDYRNLSIRLTEAEDLQGAEKAIERSVRIYVRISADFPNMPDLRRGFAHSRGTLGEFYKRLGKLPQAEAEFRQASMIQESLRASGKAP